MIHALSAPGVGLNLTRANNVISLDLGWSQAVEAQAFDRVHRVGQVRDVLVQRVVIADTVENRILDMQNRKQDLADGSLGEGSGKKIGSESRYSRVSTAYSLMVISLSELSVKELGMFMSLAWWKLYPDRRRSQPLQS